MVKESAWKCSQCGGNGHNSRTCNSRPGGRCTTIKLFGVTIAEMSQAPMKKSSSLDNLPSSSSSSSNNPDTHHLDEAGYLTDGPILSRQGKSSHSRKRGTWSYPPGLSTYAFVAITIFNPFQYVEQFIIKVLIHHYYQAIWNNWSDFFLYTSLNSC